MSLVQNKHVVKQLATAAADLALRYYVLPRTSNGGPHRGDVHRANCSCCFDSVLRVAIEHEELGNSIVGEGLAQLLRNPDARRMTRDMAVQDAATIVADDEEAVEHTEPKSWDGKGIHGGDGFAVIAQESQPTLGGLWTPRRSPHPAGDGDFRYLKAEHEKFAVDAGRTPAWILRDHLKDQLTDRF